jgi:hypothetical protein
MDKHILLDNDNLRMRWVRHVERMGQMRNVYSYLVGKPEGTRALGRSRNRWEDNIITDIKETEKEGGCGLGLSGSG